MSKGRFVVPETVRLELSDGDWIEVKEQLTVWERDCLTGVAFGGLRGGDGVGPEVGLNYAQYNMRKALIWLVDWSFRDGDDKPVPLSEEMVRNLTPDAYDEIEAAIDAHAASVEERKKVPNGGST